jgi:hypothetical protein
MRTALLDCLILVLILALFSILGCGSHGVSIIGEQEQVEQNDNAAGSALPPSVPADSSNVIPDPAEVAPVAVPAVIGMSFEEASAALGNLGFVVTSGQDYSERTAAGGICDQKPTGGSSAPQGSSVFIVVSQGTAWVTCSSCRGTGTVSEQYTCPECSGTGLCDS